MSDHFCVCGGSGLRHFEGCPTTALIDQQMAPLVSRCDELDLALGRALTRIGELEASLNRASTIPSPPFGDSHSGAIVVPHGSSNPPPLIMCGKCGMFACVCYADLPKRDLE